MPHEIREVDLERYALLCQETSPKRWFGNMEMTSNCDVTNSEHQIQMTTIWPWTKHPPWKFSAYTTALVCRWVFCIFMMAFSTTESRQPSPFCKVKLGMLTKTPYLCTPQFYRMVKSICQMNWHNASSKSVDIFVIRWWIWSISERILHCFQKLFAFLKHFYAE